MKPFPSFRTAFLGAALALGAGLAAHAQGVVSDVNTYAAYARNWNLITLGNATFSGSSDVQGGIAVGGNLSISGNWTFASNVSDTPDPSIFLGGQLSLSSGTTYENNGFASMTALSTNNWHWNASNKDLTNVQNSSEVLHMNSGDAKASNSPLTNAGPAGWSWTTAASEFKSISTNLATQTATGTIQVDAGQNLTFTTTQTTGVVVFDLYATDLSGNSYNGHNFSNISVNVPSGVDYVINVLGLCDGQTLFGSANFNSGSNDDQLLWNFVDTASGTSTIDVNISQGGNFYGSILAPRVNLNDTTTINGQVVAASFTDNGVELHDTDFTSVVVPEPRTYALWAVGLCGAMILVGRRLRRPADSAAA